MQNFNLGIDAFPDTSTLNVGQEVNLIAIINPPQSLSNLNFVWQEITVDTKVLPFNTESINIVASSNDTTTKEIRYVLIATSPKGCVQREEIRFNLVFPFLLFPNAFTPDGDQVNDAFGMIVLKGLAYVARMEIFNRWGQIVYQSTDEAATWDGTIDGKEAPADVYVYRVWWRRGDDALQVLVKGDVTLLR
ncbi:MAG: gliding motility-associated C-terminal domain-containing protein [Saprospiraceae bacterium]|nr:gliding motility-associated C-terminal domain-containing protein [Saprospiraceae bacterium]